MALSAKQKLFINEYLQTFNATQAAISAGYSEKTAYSIGWETLKKPEVVKAVRIRLSESAMSADEVLMRLAKIARNEEHGGQLRSLELLAKHHDLLSDTLKIKLQDELESTLSLLEQNLDQETYNRVLTILASAG